MERWLPQNTGSVQDYVKKQDEKNAWLNHSKTNIVSMVGRFSAIMEDFDTLDWAYEELKNISQEIQKNKTRKSSEKFYDGQRISALFDVLYLLDERILLSSKLDLLEKIQKFRRCGSLRRRIHLVLQC